MRLAPLAILFSAPVNLFWTSAVIVSSIVALYVFSIRGSYVKLPLMLSMLILLAMGLGQLGQPWCLAQSFLVVTILLACDRQSGRHPPQVVGDGADMELDVNLARTSEDCLPS